MNEYDTALKALLRDLHNSVVEMASGFHVERWLPTEAFKPQDSRLDLLAETVEGELLHIELQSTNHSRMPLRMAEYCLSIYRQTKRFPRQLVLYFGEERLTMEPLLSAPNFLFRYEVFDIRNLDAERLLASPWVADNVMAVLGRLRNRRSAVREILARIASAAEPDRYAAMQHLLTIAGLRKMADEIQEEAKQMPILNDIMDHEVFGPLIRQGLEKGLEKGQEQGIRETLRRQMADRFGPLDSTWDKRFANLSRPELDALSLRILRAASLEELFR